MVDSKTLIIATLGVGREFFRPPSGFKAEFVEPGGDANAIDAKDPSLKLDLKPDAKPGLKVNTKPASQTDHGLVPIRSLSERHRRIIARHLLALNASDRYLRFGYAAQDTQIQTYVDQLNFERDEIYGIYNRKVQLIAVAHLALSGDPKCNNCAEFGVSVLEDARGKGYGSLLFDRAVTHARAEGVDLMFIHALSENTAMLKIARNAGATVERDGSESEAYLKMPPATLDTKLTDIVEEQLGEMDFQLKVQAKRFWEFLAAVQEVRQGVRDARHQSAE